MSIVHEEQLHPTGAEIMVTERVKGESIQDWEIVSLSFDHFSKMTPDDLCDLGHWLIEHGKRIKREYKKSGKPKAPVSDFVGVKK